LAARIAGLACLALFSCRDRPAAIAQIVSTLWEFRANDAADSSPAIGQDGTVYVGSGDGRVYALHGATGALRWEAVTGGGVDSSPAIGASGRLYVGSAGGVCLALQGNIDEGLAASFWPAFRQSSRHSGQAPGRLQPVNRAAEAQAVLPGGSTVLSVNVAGLPPPAL
jgi:hypothetical protein